MRRLIFLFLVLSLVTSSIPAEAIGPGAWCPATQAASAYRSFDNQALAPAPVAGEFHQKDHNAKINEQIVRQAASAAASGSNVRGKRQGSKIFGSVSSFVERWYYPSIATFLIAISIAGFLPAMVDPARRKGPISLLAAVHGIIFFAWQIIYIVQSLLAKKHRAWHRKLGWISAGLLVIMMISGFTTTTAMLRRGFDLSGDQKIVPQPPVGSDFVDPGTGASGDYLTLFAFGALAAAAIGFHRRPDIHRRLMVFANINLVLASIAHLVNHFSQLPWWFPFAVYVGLNLSVVIRDYVVKRRVKAMLASLVLAAGTFFYVPFQNSVIIPSKPWQEFIQWLAPQVVPNRQSALHQSA